MNIRSLSAVAPIGATVMLLLGFAGGYWLRDAQSQRSSDVVATAIADKADDHHADKSRGHSHSHGHDRMHSHDRDHTHDHDPDHEEHGDHIDLSATAVKNLGLKLAPVGLQTFRKHLPIPASVIEKPGQSGLTVTAPTQGIIREIHRFPGQSLQPGDRLFTIRVTDEALEAAQLSLLDILTRITVTERELDRLDPLAETGAIVGRRKLEMDYQLKQLLSEREARLQELRLRGLSATQVARIVDQRELVAEIEVRLEVGDSEPDSGPIYTVEQLDVFPGRSVRKGDELCHIANHHELFIRGEAFESDVPAVRDLAKTDWTITAEFDQGGSHLRVEGLRVTYLDNHVDPTTQTFPFYLALENEVVAEQHDAAGRLFRSWRFKPGQRAHLHVPVDEWIDQIVLPRDAVVRTGPEAFVFRLEDPADFTDPSLWDSATSADDLADSVMTELEPVGVHVIYQDRHSCVIAADGELQVGDVVAMNRAYQLFLAWKLQMSGGDSGHHHDH